MDKRFKPLLAAAFAAGLIPVADKKHQAQGAAITAGNFTFEGLPTVSTTATAGTIANSSATTGGSSFSYSADFASPGYTATMLAVKSSTAGNWFPSAGNAPSPINSINGTNMFGSSYTFKFKIDQLQNLVVSFDGRPSGTGPQSFAVEYSLDGTTFNTVGVVSITTAAFSSFSFTMPAGFSDAAIGLAGNDGFFRLEQSGTAAASGTPGTAGTFRLDNVMISGDQVPEPATAGILAAGVGALLCMRRRES